MRNTVLGICRNIALEKVSNNNRISLNIPIPKFVCLGI